MAVVVLAPEWDEDILNFLCTHANALVNDCNFDVEGVFIVAIFLARQLDLDSNQSLVREFACVREQIQQDLLQSPSIELQFRKAFKLFHVALNLQLCLVSDCKPGDGDDLIHSVRHRALCVTGYEATMLNDSLVKEIVTV